MKEIMVKQAIYEMQLKQLGAKIVSYHGLHCLVNFNLSGFEIQYAYNINSKNQFFLQRKKPYRMSMGNYDEISDVVQTITIDLDRVKKALGSGKFDKFIDINTRLLKAAKDLEDLFLEHIIDDKVFDELGNIVTDVEQKIIVNKRMKDKLKN